MKKVAGWAMLVGIYGGLFVFMAHNLEGGAPMAALAFLVCGVILGMLRLAIGWVME